MDIEKLPFPVASRFIVVRGSPSSVSATDPVGVTPFTPDSVMSKVTFLPYVAGFMVEEAAIATVPLFTNCVNGGLVDPVKFVSPL